MPREIKTYDWCDPCAEKGDQTPGEQTPPITIGNISKPRTLLLCEAHRKEYLDGLRDLINDWGELKETAAQQRAEVSGTGEFPCLVPGCAKPMYHYKSSLRNHLRQTHNMTQTEHRRLYGDGPSQPELEGVSVPQQKRVESPATDRNPDLTSADFTCTEPGCDKSYDPAKYTRPAQALAVHKHRAHGIGSAKKKS